MMAPKRVPRSSNEAPVIPVSKKVRKEESLAQANIQQKVSTLREAMVDQRPSQITITPINRVIIIYNYALLHIDLVIKA